MKARPATQGQDPQGQHWQELAAADPAYREWHDQRNTEDHQAFNDWLDSPEGHEWINAQAEAEDEREGRSIWNHDGFSPEPRYAH